MAVAWSASLAVLRLLELGVGGRPTVVGPSLIGLGVASVALALARPRGGRGGARRGWRRGRPGARAVRLAGRHRLPSRLPTTGRGALAILGSGLLALVIIAWGASPAGPLGAGVIADDPKVRQALGLALVAIVAAVALRTGLIPFHVWAARFMEGVSPLAIPAAFTWGSAAFVLDRAGLEPGRASDPTPRATSSGC